MKIVAPVHWYLPHHAGGAETMLHIMLRALVDRGHEVTVTENRPPLNDAYRHDGLTLDGVRVVPYHEDHDETRVLFSECDVAISHLENTHRSVILSRFMNKPLFVLDHNDHPNTEFFARDTDFTHVYNSEWMRDSLVRPGVQYLVVRPPVLSEDFRTTPGKCVTQINLNADKGAHVFYALAERNPKVPFLGVVGAHGTQIIRDLPNVTIVEHTDPRRMAEAVYSRTKVLLMPSVYESWGRAGVEAMASGIPVLAHPTNGLLESLGSAGSFADRDDIQDWQTNLKRLLSPRGWHAASKRALARSAQLDATRQADLDLWVRAVESRGRDAVSYG